MDLVSGEMSGQPAPISWLTLEEGTPVLARGGEEVGKVSEVVADAQKDIFSGLAFKSGLLGSSRFAPAAAITSMTLEAVHLDLTQSEAEELEPYRA